MKTFPLNPISYLKNEFPTTTKPNSATSWTPYFKGQSMDQFNYTARPTQIMMPKITTSDTFTRKVKPGTQEYDAWVDRMLLDWVV